MIERLPVTWRDRVFSSVLVIALVFEHWKQDDRPIVHAAFWFTLLLFAAVTAGYLLLQRAPAIENATPANAGDFQFPTTDKSRVVPVVFGTVRQRGPNVPWYGDYRPQAITQETGGQFFGLLGGSEQVVGFRYFAGIQFGVCRADDDTPADLLRVWIGEDEVFSGLISGTGSFDINLPELFGGDQQQGGVVGKVSWFPGTSTQPASTYLAGLDASEGQSFGGVTPQYVNTAYGVFEGGYIGNTTQIRPWSWEVRRIPNKLGLSTPSVNGGFDANPMEVAYELITHPEWGMRHSPSRIDTAAFVAAANTLASEGNGFSMLLDKSMKVRDLLDEIGRQIDGAIFYDHARKLWTVQLARPDYDPLAIPHVTEPVEVRSYNPSSFQDTANAISVQFQNRADDYNEDVAPSQDTANALMQGGGTITTLRRVRAPRRYAGIKDPALASSIADRDALSVGRPLIQVVMALTREFYDLVAFGVFAWTDTSRKLNRRVFRIREIDGGNPDRREIVVSAVEDAWQARVGGFAPAPPTAWPLPSRAVVAVPAAEQLAFEAPRGFVVRRQSVVQALIWAAARRGPNAISVKLTERHAAGVPSGAFAEIGQGFDFMLLGKLKAALPRGSAIPLATLDLDPDPDAQAIIEAAFGDNTNTEAVGSNLFNLLYVGDEYMLPMSAAISGSDVRLTDVYRGELDSVQKSHALGEPVFLIFVGGVLGLSPIPETDNVDVELLPSSGAETLVSGAGTTLISFQMDRRARRPYAPASMSLEGIIWKASASLEGAGTGPEDYGLDLSYIRRDYRTVDEIAALLTDAASIFGDFPTANTTTAEVVVTDDPDGTPTLLFTTTGLTVAATTVRRLEILKETGGVIPTRMRLGVQQKHTDAGLELLSREITEHDFNTTTALVGFNFGSLDRLDVSNLYTADAAGVHAFTLSSAFATGTVEYRLNGGAWTTLVTEGQTTGSIAGVVVSDTIEIRHDSFEDAALKQIDLNAPGAGTNGYAVLFNSFTFDPTAPASATLVVWLDAGDPSTLVTSGSSVSQWSDKSGNANHATQATGAKQPVTTTIGGKIWIQGDGIDDRLEIADDASINFGTGEFTIFVSVVSSDTSRGQVFRKGILSRYQLRFNQIAGNDGKMVYDIAESGAGQLAVNAADLTFNNGTARVLMCAREFAGVNNDRIVFKYDNTEDAQSPKNNPSLGDIDEAVALTLFEGSDGTSQLAGSIREVLVYSGFVSNAEQTVIVDGMKAKAGIP